MRRIAGGSVLRSVVLAAVVVGLVGVRPRLANAQAGGGQANDQGPSQDPGQNQGQGKASSLWNDFSHYIYIARPQLAADSAQQLLDQSNREAMLSAVESARYDPEKVFDRAEGMDDVKAVAGELKQAVEQARLERSRDQKRIAKNIKLLDKGQRPYRNAVRRLKEAGQFAAPQLLAALRDQNNSSQHPYLINAMATIGRPLSYPLAVALPDLAPVTKAQVAQILARIGYPTPLPYMKQVLENKQTDPSARKAVKAGYDQLIAQSNLTPDLSSAQLFERVGRRYYRAGTDHRKLAGLDEKTGRGIIWAYSPDTGLVEIPVPSQIYDSVRAKRAAKGALRQNASLDSALSLFLASDLRRENRLPEAAQDPSDQEDQPGSFFAMLAGPQRQHDVLSTALEDKDPALALDAISALSKTAATDALTTTRESLMRALSYPDRRVRFNAAEALAAAHPSHEFAKSFRVVPVLADQVRQSDKRYALVLGDDQETVNQLLSAMDGLDFEAFGGTSLNGLAGQIDRRPGVDLMVIARDSQGVSNVVSRSASNVKLQDVPVLALVSKGDQIRLRSQYSQSKRVHPVVRTTDSAKLEPAVKKTISSYSGKPIGSDEARQFSLRALDLLRDLALRESEVYNVLDAQNALEQALGDERDDVVTAAGKVLALIDNRSAQRSLATAALENSQGKAQVSLLQSLAESATQYGNKLSQDQTDTLLQLVRSSSGQTAIAAAQAHGALMLETSNAVKLIVGEEG